MPQGAVTEQEFSRRKDSREFNRLIEEHTKRALNVNQEAWEAYLSERRQQDRPRDTPPDYAGFDERKFSQIHHVENMAALARLRGTNPYIPSWLSDKMDVIVRTSLAFSESMTEDSIASDTMFFVAGEANQNYSRLTEAEDEDDIKNDAPDFLAIARTAEAVKSAADRKIDDAQEHIERAHAILRYLSGDAGHNDVKELNDYAQAIYGLDLEDSDVREARKNIGANQLEKILFTCEDSALISREGFVERFSATAPHREAPSPREVDYANATFGRAFNGVFGVNGRPVPENHPMYLGKFDNIFIGGRNVTELCREAVNGMGAKEAHEYMVLYTTAKAIERKSHIDCIMPKTTVKELPDGKIQKDIAPGRQPGSKVISMISDVKEKTPKPNWFKRALNKIGLYRIVNAQTEYEKMLADDKGNIVRKADIEGRFNREQIQRELLSQMKELREPHNCSATFFDFDDLAKLNPQVSAEIMKMDAERLLQGDPPLTREDKYTSYFRNTQVGGIETIGRSGSRDSVIRLYMLSKGYSADQVVSPDDTNVDVKRQIGKEFYELLRGGDPQKIGLAYAKMAETLSLMKLPDIDYTNDAELVSQYKNMHLMCQSSIDFVQSISLRDEDSRNPRERNKNEDAFIKCLGTDRSKPLDNALRSSQILDLFNMQFENITGVSYSDSNHSLRREVEAKGGIFKFGNTTPDAQAANMVVSKHLGEMFNDLYADAKGKNLSQISSELEHHTMPHLKNYFGPLRQEMESNADAFRAAVDFFNGKTTVNPQKALIESTLESVDYKPNKVAVIPAETALLRVVPPKAAAREIEGIDVGELSENAGIKKTSVAEKPLAQMLGKHGAQKDTSINK